MPTTVAPAGTNLALLVGTLSRPPELRPLPSGEVVLALELTVRPATRRTGRRARSSSSWAARVVASSAPAA
jgi:single-stranded DNA-binding protein